MKKPSKSYLVKLPILFLFFVLVNPNLLLSNSYLISPESIDRISFTVASDNNLGNSDLKISEPNAETVMVTFNVTVPENTPEADTVFIVGTFNGWNPGETSLTKLSINLWQGVLALPQDSTFEYKFTRGSWETVEKDANGNEIENRLISTGSINLVVSNEVASWADLGITSEPENISPILSYFNSSPQTSIAITWASEFSGESMIYYGVNDINENQIIVTDHKDLIEVGDSLIHIARVTGLIPNTTYQYKVETAGVFESDTLSFTTAAEETEFTFAVGGDNQLALIEPVLDRIILDNPRFMIHCGDLVVDGNVVSEWYQFLDNFREFNGNYAMMPVYGNHEEDSPTMAKLFQHPSNGSPEPLNEGHWFSFDYNNVHFIGLDVMRDFTQGSEQYNWLQNDLQSIDENIDHRIVYFHKPAYNSTGYHGPDLQVRHTLEPLFIQYKVDLVFSGHNHHYERSLANGITYITTGGLGAWLKDFNPGSNPWSVYAEKSIHYCRVTVSGQNIKVEMVRPDGSVGDTFESLQVDGNDGDWLNYGIDPLLDTDNLQTDPELQLERFYITQDADYFYFAFDAPAKNKGISYGIYIDVDNVAGSGGTNDRWGKAVAADFDHLPEIEIYAFHSNTDEWSPSSPKYYSWDNGASDWVSASGGMGSLPTGGIFAVDTISRFFEMAIPKDVPGFNNADSFFVELFTVGETTGAGASESIPSDSTIQFTIENTSTDFTTLTAFYGFNVAAVQPPDLNPIKIDGNPADWIGLDIDQIATDTDNAQQGTEYKMDSHYVFMDSLNVYFGFRTPAQTIGLHYGMYIDTDNTSGSGGTSDKWACSVTAVSNHLPDVTIYAYHNDDGGWSSSSPKYYTWNGSDWNDHSGGQGTLPPGGRFAHNSDLDFVEILVPRTSPGLAGVSNFYISLFNFGLQKYVCETVPSDPAVTFYGENTLTSVQLSSFSFFEESIVSVKNSGMQILPSEFSLNQNYPNPFNPSTTISYSLPITSVVSIKVYDILGRQVAALVNEEKPAGSYKIDFNRDNFSSGVYIYSMRANGFVQNMKMILLK